MKPKERALELTTSFYSKLEHTFNDEYSKYDWDICVSCAMDVVNIIEVFMKEDDILTDTCYYPNSTWPTYWIKVREELENLHKENEAYRSYCKEFDKENPPFSAPYPKKLTKIEFFEKNISDEN